MRLSKWDSAARTRRLIRWISRFTIHEGEQQFVRQVITSGLHTTHARAMVNRPAGVRNPGPACATAMAETPSEAFTISVIFSQVEYGVQNPDGEEERRNVLYDIEEAHRYSLHGGRRPAVRPRIAEATAIRPTFQLRAARAGHARAFRSGLSQAETFSAWARPISFQSRVFPRCRSGPQSLYSSPAYYSVCRSRPTVSILLRRHSR